MKILKFLAIASFTFALTACVSVEEPAEEELPETYESMATYENTIYGYRFDYPESGYTLSPMGMEDLSYGEEKYGVLVLSPDPDYYRFEITPILSDNFPEFGDYYSDSVNEAFQEKNIKELAEMNYEINKKNIVEEFNETVVGDKQAFQFVLSGGEKTGFKEVQGGRSLKKPSRTIYVFDGTTFYKINKDEGNAILDKILGSLSFDKEGIIGEVMDYDHYTVCDNNNFPFKYDKFGNAHGQFTFTGTIETSEEPTPWAFDDNITSTFVRMIVNESDSPEAEQYFLDMVEGGNSVNDKDGDKLAFYMGVIEDGKWEVFARHSDSEKKVMSAIESGEELSLKFTLGFSADKGATEKFSFACEIEAL